MATKPQPFAPCVAELTGLTLAAAVFALIIAATLGSWLGLNPGWPAIATATLATGGGLLAWGRHARQFPTALKALATAIALSAFSIWLALQYLDLGTDGYMYQLPAVISLANGWSPFSGVVPVFPAYTINYAILHYPHGWWLAQAALYNASHNIETIKALSILLAWAAALVWWGWLARGQNTSGKIWVTLGIAALTLNPVFVYQVATNYADAPAASALLIVLALGLQALHNPTKTRWLLLGAALALVPHIKFTGLIYSLILFALIGTLHLLHTFRSGWRTVLPGIALMAGLTVSVFGIGASSYGMNLLTHANPVYPVLTPQGASIIADMAPANFNPLPAWNKTLRSWFASAVVSPPTGFTPNYLPPLKIPFSITQADITANGCYAAALRFGGFGPWFSGVLLLSLPLLFLTARRASNQKTGWNHPATALPFIAIVLLALPLLAGWGWWARQYPLAWWVPLLPALACLAWPAGKTHTRLLACAIILTALVNTLLLAAFSQPCQLMQAQAFKQLVATLSPYKQTLAIPNLNDGNFIVQRRLLDAGIPVVVQP